MWPTSSKRGYCWKPTASPCCSRRYRIDNMLFDPAGATITVVDWQTLTVGLPARDLAYFFGTSLQPQLRKSHERRLVLRYHDALRAHGVRDYPDTECWRDYRLGMLRFRC